MNNNVAIELKNISKSFGGNMANKNVNLTVNRGEILSILGENGSGKTTLMNMISGIYFPDEGQIFINGDEVSIRSPKDAFKYGIGMIHQHFKLIDVFSATENIILGLNEKGRYNIKAAALRVKEISDKYGFDIDPMKKIHEMSVSEKQTVEIIKVLYRGADILILDEPTAVLTPQETQKLFAVIRKMKEDGKSIIIITHKLHEVLSLSDKVAVLRKGEYVGTVETASTNESELTEMMVGKKISLNIERSEPENCEDRLVVNGLNCVNREGKKILNDISFVARSGEILGIAGIAGSGQRELLEAIAGLQHINEGEILYNGRNIKELATKYGYTEKDLETYLRCAWNRYLYYGKLTDLDVLIFTPEQFLECYKTNPSDQYEAFCRKLFMEWYEEDAEGMSSCDPSYIFAELLPDGIFLVREFNADGYVRRWQAE